MGSKWRKARTALGLHLCVHLPRTLEDPSPACSASGRSSDVSSISSALSAAGRPTTPTPSSSGLRLSIGGGHKSSSKRTCAICLTTMKPGQGHAIFTAECSHAFHFHCITSNVSHGNQVCPVCRAKWREVPCQSPTDRAARPNVVPWPRDASWATALRPSPPPPRTDANRHLSSVLHAPEPSAFNDDEILDHRPEISRKSDEDAVETVGKLLVQTYPEVSAVPRSSMHSNFAVLIHLKAPVTSKRRDCCMDEDNLLPMSSNRRASVDLVTVLDVSGSMAGTKLALLKRAMGFVIQNLGPFDRLSVISFSSTARRLFPLRRMTDTGREQALQAVNALTSSGGTNIAEGLRKGAKVMIDRKWKNPVSSIILLSDGQDTYTIVNPSRSDCQTLLPSSIQRNGVSGFQIPVHTFGFGVDHDAVSMHSISETSGGTFSFIETESVMQDAFAQCIGGLLSVVIQEFQLGIECVDPSLRLGSISAGSYRTSILAGERAGFVDGGDLYAEEERGFLVTIDIPMVDLGTEMSLLKIKCVYRDPITKEMVTLEDINEVKIDRPGVTVEVSVSMEVDRQRNRLRAAEAMAEARAAAERGDLNNAVAVLESCRRALSETATAKAGDRLCVSLDAELKETQERMANRSVYEASGRAYVLSGLSSHSWQRATARGDSTDSTSLVHAYQTPSMVNMVTRSQTMVLGEPPSRRRIRQVRSFPARPEPR